MKISGETTEQILKKWHPGLDEKMPLFEKGLIGESEQATHVCTCLVVSSQALSLRIVEFNLPGSCSWNFQASPIPEKQIETFL